MKRVGRGARRRRDWPTRTIERMDCRKVREVVFLYTDNELEESIVISFRELSNVDEYLFASGQRPRPADYAVLNKYDELIAGKHCYQHCGACLSSCPEGLPIDDVLRFKMYFEDYGDEREAMRQYAKLEVQADRCGDCSAPCANACPMGVPIAEATREAHRLLSLA